MLRNSFKFFSISICPKLAQEEQYPSVNKTDSTLKSNELGTSVL